MVTKKQFQDQLKKYIFISNEVQEIEGKNVNVEVENVLIGITFPGLLMAARACRGPC